MSESIRHHSKRILVIGLHYGPKRLISVVFETFTLFIYWSEVLLFITKQYFGSCVGVLLPLPQNLEATRLESVVLASNPVARHKAYRSTLIQTCPSLVSIDDGAIVAEERERVEVGQIPKDQEGWQIWSALFQS